MYNVKPSRLWIAVFPHPVLQATVIYFTSNCLIRLKNAL